MSDSVEETLKKEFNIIVRDEFFTRLLPNINTKRFVCCILFI